MLKQAWVQWIAVLLVVAGVIGAWLLRPGLNRSAQEAVVLQIAADCDSAQRACRARGDGLELELRLGPPVRSMEAFDIQLRGALATDARVEVRFQMRDMDMGLNRYRLTLDANGVWRGHAMLPVCSTGRSDWVAQLDIAAGGRRWRAELPFEVRSMK